mmetsp:Transcript_10161/g.24856  ORF Transcript_10161/g.24856 Transcript_10161/m.24856 type:complete len:200 (-) Transcript_10161:430-1029(-)
MVIVLTAVRARRKHQVDEPVRGDARGRDLVRDLVLGDEGPGLQCLDEVAGEKLLREGRVRPDLLKIEADWPAVREPSRLEGREELGREDGHVDLADDHVVLGAPLDERLDVGHELRWRASRREGAHRSRRVDGGKAARASRLDERREDVGDVEVLDLGLLGLQAFLGLVVLQLRRQVLRVIRTCSAWIHRSHEFFQLLG